MNIKAKRIISVLCVILSVILMFGCSKGIEPTEVSTLENDTVQNEYESQTHAVTTVAASPNTTKNAPSTEKKQDDKKDTGATTAAETKKSAPQTQKPAVETKKSTAQTNTQDKKNICTISIDCETVLNNKDKLDEKLIKLIPSSGTILPTTQYYIKNENTTVFDVLKSVCKDNGIHLEFSYTPAYHSTYIEGIGNLYERDCGSLSGWMYSVNGEYPNVGCSEVTVKNGDVIKWRYTCDLGWDVGAGDFNE